MAGMDDSVASRRSISSSTTTTTTTTTSGGRTRRKTSTPSRQKKDASLVMATTTTRPCSDCGIWKSKDDFPIRQWEMKNRRCFSCLTGNVAFAYSLPTIFPPTPTAVESSGVNFLQERFDRCVTETDTESSIESESRDQNKIPGTTHTLSNSGSDTSLPLHDSRVTIDDSSQQKTLTKASVVSAHKTNDEHQETSVALKDPDHHPVGTELGSNGDNAESSIKTKLDTDTPLETVKRVDPSPGVNDPSPLRKQSPGDKEPLRQTPNSLGKPTISSSTKLRKIAKMPSRKMATTGESHATGISTPKASGISMAKMPGISTPKASEISTPKASDHDDSREGTRSLLVRPGNDAGRAVNVKEIPNRDKATQRAGRNESPKKTVPVSRRENSTESSSSETTTNPPAGPSADTTDTRDIEGGYVETPVGSNGQLESSELVVTSNDNDDNDNGAITARDPPSDSVPADGSESSLEGTRTRCCDGSSCRNFLLLFASPLLDEKGSIASVLAGMFTLSAIGSAIGIVSPKNPSFPTVWYQYTSAMIGYIYFICWSISFYPQVISNFRRKTTRGLSADFCVLNVIGFGAYTAYNASMFWSSEIRTLYKEKYHSEVTVQSNDVAFAIHALVLSTMTLAQIVYYRGSERPSKIIVLIIVLILTLCATFPVLVLYYKMYSWLDYLYLLSYVKIAISLIKYMPQVVLNYRRKSTAGWSIWNILLDFMGGLLSDLQLVGDCWAVNDFSGITGNVAKFCLGFVSIFFDIAFMTQHYILYPESSTRESGVPGRPETEPLLSSQDREAAELSTDAV